MRSLRQKILITSGMSLFLAFLLLGVTGAYGLSRLVRFFGELNGQRSERTREAIHSSFENNVSNIRTLYRSQLEGKGWSVLVKDSASALLMLEDNAFGQLRGFLRENFKNDTELLAAAFFVREGRTVRAWQVHTREYPGGLDFPAEYDERAGGWRGGVSKRPVFIRDEAIRELSRAATPSVVKRTIKSFDPRRDSTQEVLDCIIPVAGRSSNPERIRQALRQGEPVAYLRYVLSFERMEQMIAGEKERFEASLRELGRRSQEASAEADRGTLRLLRGVFGLLALSGFATFLLSYVISSILSARITRSVNELTRVAKSMSGGNYRQSVDVRSDDEIGVLADSFRNLGSAITRRDDELAEINRNLESMVELRTRQLNEQYQTVSGLLNSMKQAVFAVLEDHCVAPPVSRHATEIFPEGIEGRSILDTLFRGLDRLSPEFAAVSTVLSVVFGEDELQWDLVESNLPREVKLDGKTLKVAYSPIWDERGRLARLMLTVEDLTDLLQLQERVRAEQASSERNIEAIQELARLPAGRIEDLVEGALELLQAADADRRAGNFESLRRRVHTLKGNSRTFGADTLGARIHAIELSFPTGQRADDPEAWGGTIQRLTDEVAVYVILADRIFRVVSRRQDWTQADLRAEFEFLLASVPKMAASVGKTVKVEMDGPDLQVGRSLASRLRAALQHLLANAIDHGIMVERPGVIGLHWWLTGSGIHRTLTVEITDDGRGLNLAALLEKAIAAGRICREEAAALGPSEKASLGLISGITTRDTVTPLSGMGRGLDSVRVTIEELGGVLAIEPRKGGGTVARIVLLVPGELQSSIL